MEGEREAEGGSEREGEREGLREGESVCVCVRACVRACTCACACVYYACISVRARMILPHTCSSPRSGLGRWTLSPCRCSLLPPSWPQTQRAPAPASAQGIFPTEPCPRSPLTFGRASPDARCSACAARPAPSRQRILPGAVQRGTGGRRPRGSGGQTKAHHRHAAMEQTRPPFLSGSQPDS
jgi:hypothetical protein